VELGKVLRYVPGSSHFTYWLASVNPTHKNNSSPPYMTQKRVLKMAKKVS
jgi:hypothetical protein